MSVDYVARTLQSGIEPFTFLYAPIADTEFQRVFAYRSLMNVNSVFLGVLTAAQYRVVAERSVQCVRLAHRQLFGVCTDIKRRILAGRAPSFVSVPVPLRMLEDGSLYETLAELFDRLAFDTPAKLSLEFPIELLYLPHGEALAALTKLRELGVLTALTDFGEPSSPTLSLYDLPIDYVFLAPCVTEMLREGSGVHESVISFAARQGRVAVLGTLEEPDLIRAAAKCGAAAYHKATQPFAADGEV